MQTTDFVSQVKWIKLIAIRPNVKNPRGQVEKDESYERLVDSIDRVGILVPLVVRELSEPLNGIRFELVDGERRFRAAKELAKESVPAHVLREGVVSGDLRKLMFHLHMTREQWGPMAQCRSLVDAYPKLDAGLKFDEKPIWTKRLAEETGMPTVTARDRIHILAWPKELKQRFFEFDEAHPKKNIYSYVLAIEASVVEPSLETFPQYFNHGQISEHTANRVRSSLLAKTCRGIETGLVRSREQIREVSPLFVPTLDPSTRRIALSLFRELVERDDCLFDDIKAEITTRLPMLSQERPAKPKRVTASIVSLTRTLSDYDPQYVRSASKKDRDEFESALSKLNNAIKRLQTGL